MSNVYKPREDSAMLEQYVRQYAKGSVLDIGTGSAVQAIAAAQNKKVSSVLATDIQKSVIEHSKNNIKNKKITFIVSDLFKNLRNKKFEAIIFNPPYLPQELKVKDLTLEGGKKGSEVIEKFLNEVNNFLKTDGIILIVFSSLTNKNKINEFIGNNLLEFKELAKKHIFFEDLYVYKINKSTILKKLEQRRIKNIRYFSKGKRGFIFTGTYNNKKIAVKIKNPKSEAILRINNEINFLRLLNKKNIGPNLLFSDKDYLIYGFIDGDFIIDYLKNNGKKNVKKVFWDIFRQLFVMDKLKINKEEMSNPVKHILINKKNKPVLIDAQKSKISGILKTVPVLLDFERAHYTLKPGNVTQFCDFLISKHILALLKNNNIKINSKKIINAAKKYKKQQNKDNFEKIIKLIR